MVINALASLFTLSSSSLSSSACGLTPGLAGRVDLPDSVTDPPVGAREISGRSIIGATEVCLDDEVIECDVDFAPVRQDAVESTGETVNDAAGNLIDAVRKQWDENGNLIVGVLVAILFICLIGKIFK